MTDERKFDPFKPAQPRIPGVSDTQHQEAAPTEPVQAPPITPAITPTRFTPKQLAAGAASAVLFGIVMGWMMLRPSRPTAPASNGTSTAPAASQSSGAPSASPSKAAPVVTVYNEEVATVEEMAKPWTSKRFIYNKKLSAGPVPAMLIRLPGGSPSSGAGYWAFALKAPYGKCDLELVTDLDKLRADYGYRAQQPMVADSCNLTLYHPLRRGTVGGAWVRGEVVQGPGFRPPLAIDIEVKDGRILAKQME